MLTRLATVSGAYATFILSGVLALAPVALAGEGLERGTLEQIRRDFSKVDMGRIAHVSERMDLSDPANLAFRPAYQDYLRNLVRLRDRQLEVLVEYAENLNAESLDDARAARSLAESMRLDRERMVARDRFIEGLTHSLNPRQQLRLYQLELILDAQIRTELMSQIPLAE